MLADRFWNHVDKHGPLAHHKITGRNIGRCHLWTGYINPGGYGMVGMDENNTSGKRKSALAHRAAWFLRYGRWPKKHLDHVCNRRNCVRWTHLEPVSQKENNRRNPKPHSIVCKNGHDLTAPGSKYVYSGVNKGCRQCHLDRSAAQRKSFSEIA